MVIEERDVTNCIHRRQECSYHLQKKRRILCDINGKTVGCRYCSLDLEIMCLCCCPFKNEMLTACPEECTCLFKVLFIRIRQSFNNTC